VKKLLTPVFGGLIGLSGLTGCAAPETLRVLDVNAPPAQSQSVAIDLAFAPEASIGNLHEVELGQLATQHSQNPEVIAFGQRMIQDHGQAYRQLQEVGVQQSLSLPSRVNAQAQSETQPLVSLNGPEFDRAYIRLAISDHVKDAAAFQNEAQNGQNPAIKAYAAQVLPTVLLHLQLARSIAQHLGIPPQ